MVWFFDRLRNGGLGRSCVGRALKNFGLAIGDFGLEVFANCQWGQSSRFQVLKFKVVDCRFRPVFPRKTGFARYCSV